MADIEQSQPDENPLLQQVTDKLLATNDIVVGETLKHTELLESVKDSTDGLRKESRQSSQQLFQQMEKVTNSININAEKDGAIQAEMFNVSRNILATSLVNLQDSMRHMAENVLGTEDRPMKIINQDFQAYYDDTIEVGNETNRLLNNVTTTMLTVREGTEVAVKNLENALVPAVQNTALATTNLATMYDNRTPTAAEQEEARREAMRQQNEALQASSSFGVGGRGGRGGRGGAGGAQGIEDDTGIVGAIASVIFGNMVAEKLGLMGKGGKLGAKFKSVGIAARNSAMKLTGGFLDKLFGASAKGGGGVARALGPIGAMVAAVQIGKDIFDIGSAMSDDDIRTEVQNRDIGGVIGGIVGGAIGFAVGGPMGAAFGASIGNELGNAIGGLTETPEVQTALDNTINVLKKRLETASGEEAARIQKQIDELEKLKSDRGAKISEIDTKLTNAYAERDRLNDEYEEALANNNYSLANDIRAQMSVNKTLIAQIEQDRAAELSKLEADATNISSQMRVERMNFFEKYINDTSSIFGKILKTLGFDSTKEGELAVAESKQAEAEAKLEEIRQKRILQLQNLGGSFENELQDLLQESTKFVDGKQVQADLDDLKTFKEFERSYDGRRLLEDAFGKDYLNNPEYLALKEGQTRTTERFFGPDTIDQVIEASDINELLTRVQQKREAQIQALQDADLSTVDTMQLTGSVVGANKVTALREEIDQLKDEIIRLTAETSGGNTNIFNNSETNNNEQKVEAKPASLGGKSGGSTQLLKLEQKIKLE